MVVKLEYQRFDFGSMSSEYGGTHTFACGYNIATPARRN